MKPENQPAIELRLRVVIPRHSSVARCVLHSVTPSEQDYLIRSYEWPTGRPTPAQLDDLVGVVTARLYEELVTTIGVQGVLQ